MSVLRVTITEAEEQFAPPGKEIEIALVGDKMIITVYNGSLEDLRKERTKEYEVPVLNVQDVLHAIQAHNPSWVGGILVQP